MISAKEHEQVIDQTFRDSVATINQKGKRNFLFPKKPKGALYNKRTLASVIYLLVFFTLPWIKVNGEPFIMLNVLKRKNFWSSGFLHFRIGDDHFHCFHHPFYSGFRKSFLRMGLSANHLHGNGFQKD